MKTGLTKLEKFLIELNFLCNEYDIEITKDIEGLYINENCEESSFSADINHKENLKLMKQYKHLNKKEWSILA